MKKILLFLIVTIFSLLTISALDQQTIFVCGGDDQLIVLCEIGDDKHSPFGRMDILLMTGGPELPAEIIEEIIEPKKFEIAGMFIPYWVLYCVMILFFALLFLLILIFLKKEKEKKEKI